MAGTASAIAEDLPPTDWKRLSAGEGTKGPRFYDWAYVELADLEASQYDEAQSGLWTRGLLIRRGTADGALAFILYLGSNWNFYRNPRPRGGLPLGHRG
jgi:SRSO17 transposase